jgi:hypothetical protein
MPRNIDSSVLAQLTSGSLKPANFVMLTFATSTAYLWSGQGSVVWNNQTWTSLGPLLNISTLESGTTVEARGVTVTLSGLDPVLLPACMNEFCLGLPAAIYLGVFVDGELLPNVITSWYGRMGQPTITLTAETAMIAINCESRLIDLNIASDRRYTQEDQSRYYPGDLGFSFVTEIQERTLFFGDHPLSSNNI